MEVSEIYMFVADLYLRLRLCSVFGWLMGPTICWYGESHFVYSLGIVCFLDFLGCLPYCFHLFKFLLVFDGKLDCYKTERKYQRSIEFYYS